MSYSEVINKIEKEGFYEALIMLIEKTMSTGKELEYRREQFKKAETEASICADNLKSIMLYAAENCHKYIIDNSTDVHILRVIEASCLWEISFNENTNTIEALSRVCNVKE